MSTYGRLCTEFYDLDKPSAPSRALAFYLERARQAKGPILEPMCGSGRFLVPMLQRGLDVDGTDASAHMLEACRLKCKAFGVTPALLEQRLDELEVTRRYGFIFIPAGSFGLVTEQASIRESLRRLRAALLTKAKLLLEIAVRAPKVGDANAWGGRWVDRPDGGKIVLSSLHRWDAKARISRSILRYDLVKEGRSIRCEYEDFDCIIHDPHSFRDLLEEAGFAKIRSYKAPYERASRAQCLMFEGSSPS